MTEFKSWRSFQQFDQRVRRHLRYVRTREDEDFLSTVAERATIGKRRFVPVISSGERRWGIGPRIEQDGEKFEVEIPAEPVRMKPLRDRASGGRANRVGIPCLYLATHKETAMCEVRPWIGSYISLASSGSYVIARLSTPLSTTKNSPFISKNLDWSIKGRRFGHIRPRLRSNR